MSYFPTLYGNDALKERIRKSLTCGNLSHAFIIEGPEGTGKRTFARLIAAALSCTDKSGDVPCGTCPSCEKILSDNSTDVRILDKGSEASVKIDAIRDLKRDMYLSPTENEYKVYIIDDAETMTAQAQNALLIVLEEPPKNVIIFLLTSRSDLLLPTIRSRAQLLRMSLFSREETETYLSEKRPEAARLLRESPEKFHAAVGSAGGAIGKAIEALSPSAADAVMKKRALTDALLTASIERKPFSAICDAVFSLPQKRAELSEILRLFTVALSDLIRLQKDDDANLAYYYDRETASELSSRAGSARLFRLYDRLCSIITDLENNANVNVMLTTLADDIKSNL